MPLLQESSCMRLSFLVSASWTDERKDSCMSRHEATQKILEAKQKKGLTWEEIAKAGGHSESWIATALLGQATLNEETAEKIASLLDLDDETAQALTQIPYRGQTLSMPPTDPLLYRFYEMVMVYGPAIKELIQEKAGEGIMSAIDFQFDVQTKEDPKGDRIIVTLNGKFLPYKSW